MSDDRRPTPDEMLDRARAEAAAAGRGRLKVFFGAAPGVGKTYAMLEAAQARRRRGDDVVVAWLETHGRADTEAAARGLERVPPRTVAHRGLRLLELDLDAVLARRARLVLVDELPHTNAPGSRHHKRWQDVEELLASGADVFTTLNVQHLESLRDVVASVTGVPVQETVPDAVLDAADEIEVVDLPPDELLDRLREGKVYVPEQAERAAERFFRKGNLIALRELALRRAAERVDAQAGAWRREEGVRRPWGVRDRLLVAVSTSPQSADLVRATARMAARLHAPFLALSVETPAVERAPEADRARLSDTLALATRLGGEVVVVRGDRVGDEVLAIAHTRDVTRIVVGKPGPETGRGGSSLVDWLVHHAEGVEVLVTRGEPSAPTAPPPRAPRPRTRVRHVVGALLAVAAATAVGVVGGGVLALADQAMLYVLAIVAVASWAPRAPVFLATGASVLALNWFFVPPVHHFAVADARHLLTFAGMALVGTVVNVLATRLRGAADRAQERERRTAALYALARDLAGTADADLVAATAARSIADVARAPVAVLLPGEGDALRAAAGGEADFASDEREREIARWAYVHGKPAGHGTDTLPAARATWVPLAAAGRARGVVGVGRRDDGSARAASDQQALDTLVAQTALALERVAMAEEARRAARTAHDERLRSTILSGVSHDLRTPLAAITGAADALLDPQAQVDEASRRALVEGIRSEGARLGRLVADLLDLSRIESGTAVHRDPYPLEEVVASAMLRTRSLLSGRRVAVDLPQQVLLVALDPVLMEQVLVNLLENAAKYTPPGSPVDVRVAVQDRRVVVEVADRGPGIPAGEEERVFEKFHRLRPEGVPGTGLGLAVCRAVVEAHGGRITAGNRPGGGASFRLELPFDPGEQAPAEATS